MMDQTSVVLVEPLNDINIGIALRVCRNFGISSLRLVRPRQGDPETIGVTAPNSEEQIAALERYDELDDALGDCVYTLGLTARRRSANWVVMDPAEAAVAVREAATKGRVALLFGREDSGLPNEVLDRCHGVVTIPTDPGYPSLNLGQAVLLVVWELFRLQEGKGEGVAQAAVPVAQAEEPVEMARMELLFRHAEEALESIEYFKTDTREHILRSIRSVFLRAGLEERELAIWHGIFREIPGYLRRKGVLPGQQGDHSSVKQ